MANIKSYGEQAKSRCINSPEFKIQQDKIAMSKCVDGVITLTEDEANDVNNTVYRGIPYKLLRDAITCPPFVHITYEVGEACPEGLDKQPVTLSAAGQAVSMCVGIISDATVNAGDPGSEYLFYHC